MRPTTYNTQNRVNCSADGEPHSEITESVSPSWQVHVYGPDEVYENDNELDALRSANKLNEAILAHRLKHENDPHWPYSVAIAKPSQFKQDKPEHLAAFAEWYAIHGIPLGIGRDNARVIYEAARRQTGRSVGDLKAFGSEHDMGEGLKRVAKQCSGKMKACNCQYQKQKNWGYEIQKWVGGENSWEFLANVKRFMDAVGAAQAHQYVLIRCRGCGSELMRKMGSGPVDEKLSQPEGLIDNIIHSVRMRIPGA